ncbi:MAG: ComEA family DNA-binding protein [Dehalococcoidia bacterium]
MDWLERHRTPVIALLAALIVIGGAVLLYRQWALPQSVEIVISPPSPEIHVYVEGEVVSPGVYMLQDGDRVVDAIEAAGGFTADADQGAVNLAAPLRDGGRVHVYRIGDVPQKINLNTAEAWLLQSLPGIGEILAQRIIDYRNEIGPFQQIEDLKKVEGIGAATFEKLKDNITLN